MSVSSLTRFTVPLASDQSASSQGLLMPKLKYRFRAIFEGFGVTTPRSELTKQVKTCGRPKPKFNPVTVDVYNSKIKYAGKVDWDPISVVLRDDATGSVSKLVGEQLQKQFDFMEQASAASGIDYKFTSRIEMLDGGNGIHEPTVLETWELYGCWVDNVDYGELDYSSDESIDLTLSITFDNAIQTPTDSGVGASVVRTIGDVITG